jgi:hypothetical protein
VHEYNKYGDRIEVTLNPDVTPEEKDKAKFKYDFLLLLPEMISLHHIRPPG